jgi:hypothetical protein
MKLVGKSIPAHSLIEMGWHYTGYRCNKYEIWTKDDYAICWDRETNKVISVEKPKVDGR